MARFTCKAIKGNMVGQRAAGSGQQAACGRRFVP